MNSWLLPLRRRMFWQSCSLRRALLPGRSLRRSCQRKERSMTRCFKKVASSLFAVARKANRLGSFFGRNTPILEIDMVATKTLFFVLLFLFLNASSAYPHKGKLDADGCHDGKKKHEYHCHQGKLAGQHFKSREEMLQKARHEKHRRR